MRACEKSLRFLAPRGASNFMQTRKIGKRRWAFVRIFSIEMLRSSRDGAVIGPLVVQVKSFDEVVPQFAMNVREKKTASNIAR
jgi:hypothetical protein